MSSHATPLRYPGGKQRLAPFVAEVLAANNATNWVYVEPYAGGAGIALQLLLEDRVSHVYLNDSSRHVYAVWRSILKQPDEFCDAVARASLDLATWKRHKEVCRRPRSHTIFELGISTFYLNRCNRSGILNAGVIGGQAQKGEWRIDARFPRNELIRRIEAIAAKRRQITISNHDAEAFVLDRVNRLPKETLVYCDPPYYERAERLYLNAYQKSDHERLARFIQRRLKRHWMVSYDDHADIRRFYRGRRKFRYALRYSAVRPYEGTEVFIFSDDVVIPRKSQLAYVDRGLHGLRRSA